MHPDPRFKKTAYVVEATDCERNMLWREWAPFIPWLQDSYGMNVTVGKLGDHPVCVNISWDILNDRRVMFYSDSSMVVDHRMVEKWIKENLPQCFDNVCWSTNATNFSHCLNHVWPYESRPKGWDDGIKQLRFDMVRAGNLTSLAYPKGIHGWKEKENAEG